VNGRACADCPYDTDRPHTQDGAAAWLAGSRCLSVSLGYGAADLRMDWTAALAVAAAEGCDPRAAPELLRAVADGLAKARAEARKDGEA
jgi:hypothetical protein